MRRSEGLLCERWEASILVPLHTSEVAALEAARHGVGLERLLFEPEPLGEEDAWTRFVQTAHEHR